MAQDLHQQPAAVAAGTAGTLQRFLAGLDAGLHAHHVADVLLQSCIERNQEADDTVALAGCVRDPLAQARPFLADLEIRGQFLAQLWLVDEGEPVRVLLHEKIEGIDGDHVGDQAHVHHQPARLLREHQASHEVAEGILLPVDEMFRGFHLQRVVVDRRAGMGCRAQADQVGSDGNRPVVVILGTVMDGDANGH